MLDCAANIFGGVQQSTIEIEQIDVEGLDQNDLIKREPAALLQTDPASGVHLRFPDG